MPFNPKNGTESLVDGENTTPFVLSDFWRWGSSDLLSNATRGKLSEFIVATATHFDFNNIRKDWDEYDIHTTNGIKIEVKSSAYIQSWEQKKFSQIIFSIKKNSDVGRRCSDVYVFCVLKHQDRETINPLELSQWEFVVVPTRHIDNYKRSNTHITLNSLLKISSPIDYSELTGAITVASEIQEQLNDTMTIEQHQKLLAFYKLKQQGQDVGKQLMDEHLKANLDRDRAIVHKEDAEAFEDYLKELNILLYGIE